MDISRDELKLIATTIRTLAMDAVQKANSGHPGLPMGCADIASVLWTKILSHNPKDPNWKNRDRFVLSAGHGSMLLYSMLHLSGYDLSIEDLMSFRQFRSKTPGHPETHMTPGVETTTGPLGQGFANGIGLAIARDMLASEFNNDKNVIIDHFIYAIVSDGDMMEGITSEAASLAGHMGIGRLIYIYDSNGISIEGSTDLAFTEDTAKRFESYGWHVQTIDGHDFDAIEKSINNAKSVSGKPCLIIAKTLIAKGSATMEGSEEAHGAPLGDKEIAATKIKLGCGPDSKFCVPDEVYAVFARRQNDLAAAYENWKSLFEKGISGDLKKKWDAFFSKLDIDALRSKMPVFKQGESIASRASSGKVLEALFKEVPNLIGGSADLAPSNKSFAKGFSESGKGKTGRNLHFGIREHAMGAIQNGIAYYGGFYCYTATFFTFMDYMRPAVRLAAISKLNAIYLFTHDSFFVGEDGPTHEPIEHLAAARAIPNCCVLRPADADETREAWLAALARTDGPTILALTRQNLPNLERKNCEALDLHKGAYKIRDCGKNPDAVILATGSEVHVSIQAAEDLEKQGLGINVVSFPSWELFEKQSEDYRKSVLSHGTPKIVIEAGRGMGWERYAGNHALFITMEDFGLSAPAELLAEEFGFTKNKIIQRISEFLSK